MAELSEVIQQIANRTMIAGKPTEPVIGTVENLNPLSIRLSDKILLTGDNIVLLKGLNLEKNDRVLTIMASGGQKYYVIGEIE